MLATLPHACPGPLSGRLRLALIAPFARAPKGTTQARVLPLARALAARGHHVTVLIPPYDHPAEGGERYCVGGARVEALPVHGHVREESPRQAIEQPRLAGALARRALTLRPDVVHLFKPKAVSGLTHMALWLRRAAGGGPVIVLDTDDWEGHGGWNEREAYPWWQKAVCDWQERWGLRHADAVTAASRTLETQAWSQRVPPARVAYLPNGLAPEDFRGWREADRGAVRARLGLGNRPVALLYTRFFEFEPDRMVEVLARAQTEVPDLRLLVVGAGKFAQERRLRALAAARGLGEAVLDMGWQAPAALPELLSAADVALFPADDTLANRAKCSVKLLQALWLGLPVVADRVGQQAEYVEHGASGLLTAPESGTEMAGAAVRLLRDRALAARLAAAGRRRVETEFNWSRLATRAEHAYAAGVRHRRGASGTI